MASMTRKQKQTLLSIGASAALFLLAVLLPQGTVKIALFFIAYVLVGWNVLREAR